MRLQSLSVTNFRNIRSAMVYPDEGINIFFGSNGSGKTNLLEAIFALCLGRSQRGARDPVMLGQNDSPDMEHYRLEGVGETASGKVRIACAYIKGGRKKITVDDNPARIARLYRIFSLISMAPEDVSLFTGSPAGRRRFLDLHLSQASATYLADLADYNKALAQKNSFLKDSRGEECPFDPLLVSCGSRIINARSRFIHFLQSLSPGYYHQISNGKSSEKQMSFGFNYKPNIEFYTRDEVAGNFEKKLIASRKKEAILETAIVGPHRDDLEFLIGDFPARGYGSQGELRSAAIAVMMATANFLESRREEKPILLLDEIFAELDATRRDNLARLFKQFEQVFLTTAIEPPSALSERGKIFHIRQGEVT